MSINNKSIVPLRLGNDNYNLDYISLSNTMCIKGVLSICILMHHIARTLSSCRLLSPFQHIGGLVVAVFFFYSGYGLMIQCINTPDYEKHFYRRIFALLIPYTLVTPFYMWIHDMNFKEMIHDLCIGFPVVNNSWFIIHLFLFYLVFWVLMIIFKKEPFALLCGSTVAIALWVKFTIAHNIPSFWYNCSHLLIVGMAWAIYGEQMISIIRRHYMESFILLIITFAFIYLYSRNTIGWTLYALRNIMYVLFVVLFLIVLQKVSFNNVLFASVGRISFSIYLIHGFVIECIKRFNLSNFAFVISVLSVTIFLSVIFNKVTVFVSNQRRKLRYVVGQWLPLKTSKLS